MKPVFKVTALLAAVGIGLAVYLFYEYLAPSTKASFCYVNSTLNCEASTKGVLANTLGLPTALWGLTGYLVILVAAFAGWRRVILATAAFGFFFCLRITYLEIIVVKVICPVCLACQVNMLLLFLIGIFLNKRGWVES